MTSPDARRIQLRPPRLAELIAQSLRTQILDGTLADGAPLPKLDELLESYGVSQPSMREAIRILETEGLVRVRRGRTGGGSVHAPHTGSSAYMIGLILNSKRVKLDDVGRARNEIDPMCAALCAARADRATAVVPRLREAHAETLAVSGNRVEFAAAMSRFHEALVELAGNETLMIVVGSLQRIWAADEQAWATHCYEIEAHADHPSKGLLPDQDYRNGRVEEHTQLIELIADGDVDAVRAAASAHARSGVLYRHEWAAARDVNTTVLRAPCGP